MEPDPELSSSEDEFDFTMLNEEISAIHRELKDTENNSSCDDNDEMRGVSWRKNRTRSRTVPNCTESKETPSIIPFIFGDTTVGPHSLSDK
ncbi:unnamed protein product [Ceratitis capitata]|uniref:(Mediterranean fruit fly) hypothetical protein n=1 Tax=Ceratitis capitata TaxID=7213 RepID=A0A811UE88_CERCA|nr:unnamed protein product [Ceratitis capitata]